MLVAGQEYTRQSTRRKQPSNGVHYSADASRKRAEAKALSKALVQHHEHEPEHSSRAHETHEGRPLEASQGRSARLHPLARSIPDTCYEHAPCPSSRCFG